MGTKQWLGQAGAGHRETEPMGRERAGRHARRARGSRRSRDELKRGRGEPHPRWEEAMAQNLKMPWTP